MAIPVPLGFRLAGVHCGIKQSTDTEDLTLSVSFYPDARVVDYTRDAIPELDLAYAITIHKSQGSEFEAVIIPVLTQHSLRGPLVTLYCLRHMRGNVVLEATHRNESVRLLDLAQALLHKRVTLTGRFVAVQ